MLPRNRNLRSLDRAQKKGQSKWTGPVASSDTLDLAYVLYRQQASRCRQHSIRSPQQLLAAKAKAEPDISKAPVVNLRTLFFIVVPEN